MSFGKGSNTTTSSTQANPQAMAAYGNLLSQAGQIGSTPYTPYGGEMTAPVNQQQNLGIGNINANAGFAMPYINMAGEAAQEGGSPLSASDIQTYMDPYTNSVIGATQAQFNNQNAIQQQQVQGNAAAQNALGGNRVGVAQALTAGQQQMAQAPVIAGMENQGWQQAAALAEQQRQAKAQEAYSLGNLGVAGQNAALTGANAQVGAGSLQQQTQQAYDQAMMNAFYQQEFAPEAMLSWQAGIDTGVGSQMGGSSTTTGPAPNPLAQWLGIGALGLGAYGKSQQQSARGGRIAGFARPHYASGGGLGGLAQFLSNPYLPGGQITHGSGAPKPPSAPSQQSQSSPGNLGNAAQGLGSLSKSMKNWFSPGTNPVPDGFGTTTGLNYDAAGNAIPSLDAGIMGPLAEGGDAAAAAGAGAADAAGAAVGGDAVADLLPLLLFAKRGGRIAGFGRPHRRGGGVHGYAEGGVPDDDVFPGSYDPDIAGGLSLDAGAFNPEPNMGEFAFPGMNRTNKGDRAEPIPMPSFDLAAADAKGGKRSRDLTLGEGFPGSYTDDDPIPLPPSRPGRGDLQTPAPDLPPAREVPGGPTEVADASSGPTGSLGQPRPGSQGAPDLPAQSKEAGFGGLFHMSDAASSGLMAAGLGMLASRSPFLANAVGEGGLAGLSAYSGTKHEEASAKQVADKMAQHAEETRKKLEMESAKEARLAEEHEAREADRKLAMMKPMVIDKDPYGQPVYGRMDAKGNIFTMSGEPYTAQQKAKAETTANLKGDDYIATLPQTHQAQVRQAGSYMGAIPSVNSRSPEARALRDEIFQAYPDIDERMYGAQASAVRKFWSGPDSDTIKSQNVAIMHLGTLQQAANALKNGDYQAANSLMNWWSKATGKTPPTDFNAVRNIVADELVKAVVGAKGALGDREEAKHSIDAAQSQAQLDSVINRYKDLMSGQVSGQRQKFTSTTGLSPEVFDRFLLPETKEELRKHEASPAGAAAPVLQGQDKAALDWANANPNDPRAAAIKQRLGVQ